MSVQTLSLGAREIVEGLAWRIRQLADHLDALEQLVDAMVVDEDARFAALLDSDAASTLLDGLMSRLHRLQVLSGDLKAVVSRHHRILAGGDGASGWAERLARLTHRGDPCLRRLLERSGALHATMTTGLYPRLPRSLRSYCRARAGRYFATSHGWLAQASAGIDVARRLAAPGARQA